MKEADRELLAKKLDSLGEHILSLAKYRDMKDELIHASAERRLAIERLFEIAIQAVVDTSRLLVALEGWDAKEDSFMCLAHHGVIDKSLVPRLRKAKDFRNFLAHDYEKVDPRRVRRHLSKDLIDLQLYANAMGRWLQKQT